MSVIIISVIIIFIIIIIIIIMQIKAGIKRKNSIDVLTTKSVLACASVNLLSICKRVLILASIGQS